MVAPSLIGIGRRVLRRWGRACGRERACRSSRDARVGPDRVLDRRRMADEPGLLLIRFLLTCSGGLGTVDGRSRPRGRHRSGLRIFRPPSTYVRSGAAKRKAAACDPVTSGAE
ncbi:MAG: hypothetical protein AVDCRST_MAG79-2841 [uncultured Thermoleophilia bacterium]|uniref:Uncharacterized protein n=1 Tax=uncultured Thermoleophilia bacterium TaxID=1497501 RepID=A0A6J4ULR0_9ACTN|nr:MAG: hypothetical protein AVDCRST_MAG79-2841 [uncultured Thermoleophilia bacterium]